MPFHSFHSAESILMNFGTRSVSGRRDSPLSVRTATSGQRGKEPQRSPGGSGSMSARLKVHFANWHHTPYHLYPMTTSRPISLIILRSQQHVALKFHGGHMALESRGPDPFWLIRPKLCQTPPFYPKTGGRRGGGGGETRNFSACRGLR